MKNLRILLFVVAASLFAACDDAIDITQPGELLPEETFTSLADMQLGLNGVYGAVGGETAIVFTSIFTDEVRVGRANGGQGITDGGLSFLLNSNSDDAASIWLNNYTIINFANRLITGSKDIELAEGEDVTYNNIIGQARALRAYAHIQLLTYFSTNMKDDSALGVIVLDRVPTKEEKLPRNTNAEAYALIESDLEFAAANISNVRLVTRDFITRDVVTAIRARLAAYRGQYDQAEAYANVLINDQTNYKLALKGNGANNTPVDLTLASDKLLPALVATGNGGSQYFKMFRDLQLAASPTAPNEVIFKLVKPVTPNTGNFYQAWSSVNSTTTGGAFFEVSTALFNKLAADDIRRITIIDPSSIFTGFGIRPVGKHGLSKGVNLLADVKLFRNSEMYLIKAEAQANRSDLAGVAATLNVIRAARFGNATGNIGTPANAQAAWAAILNERRIELAFEGHRYIDIKRLGAAAGVSVDRDGADCNSNACTLDITDHRWTLPVPRAELSANPNIQQNPEYN